MRRRIRLIKKSLLFLVAAIVLTAGFSVLVSAQSSDPAAERQTLEEELKKLEAQILQYDQDITKTQKEKNTLQNQISLLRKKIDKLSLQIQQGNVMIKDLGIQILDTEKSIGKTSLEIDDSKSRLSEILRTIYQENQKSVIEIILSGNKISDFFDNLMALEVLNSNNQDLLKEIKELKATLENQKDSLDSEKTELEGVVKMQTLQKQESESTRKETDTLLKLTEAQYQKILQEKNETQKKASEIRARIFELIGVPDAPTFGEAYLIAKDVESLTGVRAAFLLAILTQESNLGKNVGKCYLRDTKTGSGVTSSGKAISNVMKPSRDVAPFLKITQDLGRDPFNTPVSCPMSFGYGGAMGPAQFIPSTWILYAGELKSITGKPGDPWNIKDAFLASALYLGDCGATKQTRDSEWKAAMIYFSGSTNTRYRFYGDSVMSIVTQYEKDIAAMIQ